MKMIRFKRLLLALGCFGGLALWLTLTNPNKMPIIFLMVPFVLLFGGLWFTSAALIERFLPKLARSRRIALATSISGAPVFLMILGSVNQLTWRDVVLVLILVGFLYFYSGRIHFSES